VGVVAGLAAPHPARVGPSREACSPTGNLVPVKGVFGEVSGAGTVTAAGEVSPAADGVTVTGWACRGWLSGRVSGPEG
jgi:hypothetical protein